MATKLSASDLILTEGDQQIIDDAWARKNPSIFTNYYMRKASGVYVYPGSQRHKQYCNLLVKQDRARLVDLGNGTSRLDLRYELKDIELTASSSEIPFKVKIKKDTTVNDYVFIEDRGVIMLPWMTEFHRATQDERVIIGVPGTGKTLGVGAEAMFMCASIPSFRFLNVAPTLYQSTLMVRTIQDLTIDTAFRDKFLLPGKDGWKNKPYTVLTFKNGSTAEFMNVANNAANIQSWYGDWINGDEFGLLSDLDADGTEQAANIMVGLATRLRGSRPDGKPRLGWLSLISMAYDCDTMWDRFEMGNTAEGRKRIWSRLVLHTENPYLSDKDVDRMRRNIPVGQEAQWLKGERPQKKSAEFPQTITETMFNQKAMDDARKHVAAQSVGWDITYGGPGIVRYMRPYERDHTYVMAGDPGLGNPPDRNSPVIFVFDADKFPYEPARLASFAWIYGDGSYMPFISQFKSYAQLYHVNPMLRGYDSTSSQKALAELAFTSGEDAVIPLGFEGDKKWVYLNSLKLLMSKKLIQIPAGIDGIERQVKRYSLPDKKIPQDIVSALSMVAYMLYPLYVMAYPGDDGDEIENDEVAAVVGRFNRPEYQRHTGHMR